jgi:cytochrome oxidase Cu insertion factor (SCO1/SenC/PrrC family)
MMLEVLSGRDFLQIMTYAGQKSAIDGGAQRQAYSYYWYARWISNALKKIILTCLLVVYFGVACAGPLDLADAWIDDNGNSVKLARWRGRPVIISMEYSNCRFICSISQRKLQEIQVEADRRKLSIEFVILSLDPKNDTPASWRQYRKLRDLPGSNWYFLTGSRAATDNAALSLGVKWWYYDEHIMHELRILRLAANGEVVRIMKTYDMTAAQLLD